MISDEAMEDVDVMARHPSDNAQKPRERVPDGHELTPWGETRQQLYDEAVARFEATRGAGLHPDPFPWLNRNRRQGEERVFGIGCPGPAPRG